jgi:VWFA-related protein
MNRSLHLATLLLLIDPLVAQNPQVRPEQPTIAATSHLVIVPTQVRSANGNPVLNLRTEDFRLTDNGAQQALLAEPLDRQPLAIVVLMQTGGSAPRQFQNYRTFNILLNALLTTTPDVKIARAPHKVALVTFDSRLREIWNFPPRIDGLKHAFAHPEGGDSGAAILDALDCGLALVEQQPPIYRRIILLLSQSLDNGSQAEAGKLVRRLAASNTTIYSLSFAHRTGKLRPAPGNLEEATRALLENPAAEAATLSGGESSPLNQEDDLERALSLMASDFANTYLLSFHPSSEQTGLHTLQVRLSGKSPHLGVKARTLYWISSPTREEAEK